MDPPNYALADWVGWAGSAVGCSGSAGTAAAAAAAAFNFSSNKRVLILANSWNLQILYRQTVDVNSKSSQAPNAMAASSNICWSSS